MEWAPQCGCSLSGSTQQQGNCLGAWTNPETLHPCTLGEHQVGMCGKYQAGGHYHCERAVEGGLSSSMKRGVRSMFGVNPKVYKASKFYTRTGCTHGNNCHAVICQGLPTSALALQPRTPALKAHTSHNALHPMSLVLKAPMHASTHYPINTQVHLRLRHAHMPHTCT